jgi:hypothetical protein
MAVDAYLSNVSINSSPVIYRKLKTALSESKGADDGDISNDAYQYLIPTLMSRVTFVSIAGSMFLNGLFVYNRSMKAMHGGYDSDVMNYASMLLGICEMVCLFAHIQFCTVYTFSLFVSDHLRQRHVL